MSQVLKNIESTPISLSAIKPLDFDSPISKIPSTHLWPTKDINNHPYHEPVCVPVIDLSDPKPEQLDRIRLACEEWGFFQVVNHGVPGRILDEFKTEAVGFFSLPTEVKLRVLRNPVETSGYGGLHISKFSPRCGMRDLESRRTSMNMPLSFGLLMATLPFEYQQTIKTLAEKILTLMLASLGLTPEDTNWAEFKTNESPFGAHGAHLQLNSYPICPDPDHAMGLTQHTDSSILTVLSHINDTSGLQILHKDKWANVKPIPGSFIINNGDLAHFISNGRFLSAVHRVIPNRSRHRYSAAYFYGPPFEALVAPLPKLVGPTRVPLYRTFTWKDYLNAKSNLKSLS
ncbi:LOW QUALITY PROTEIN: hypothetical protein V2J09_002438 [Rumex salicifolius]